MRTRVAGAGASGDASWAMQGRSDQPIRSDAQSYSLPIQRDDSIKCLVALFCCSNVSALQRYADSMFES